MRAVALSSNSLESTSNPFSHSVLKSPSFSPFPSSSFSQSSIDDNNSIIDELKLNKESSSGIHNKTFSEKGVGVSNKSKGIDYDGYEDNKNDRWSGWGGSNCFPQIDAVYTWVNGSDPKHKEALKKCKKEIYGDSFIPCNFSKNDDDDQYGLSNVTTSEEGANSTSRQNELNCTFDEDKASRYVDNEELRYSLRSLEKFAPWISRVHLVTNGQIPHWINLENERLHIVTHEEIFRNLSHLPTFSSPAIEANLHRIPGLSKYFIYLNDDTSFGDFVAPDDFFTSAKGQKVFLAWSVPNCNDGCPSSWIGDGYCDSACNVSACDWDYPDCVNVSSGNAWNYNYWSGWSWDRGDRGSKYCSSGCPDSWIGDRYCDRSCNVHDCAFDAGDCEVSDIFQNLEGVSLSSSFQGKSLPLPKGVKAFYFNLSEALGGGKSPGKITDALHDSSEAIRSAAISQRHLFLALTFRPNITRHSVSFTISYEIVGESQIFTFNISIDTSLSLNSTLSDHDPSNFTNITEEVLPDLSLGPLSENERTTFSKISSPKKESTEDSALPSAPSSFVTARKLLSLFQEALDIQLVDHSDGQVGVKVKVISDSGTNSSNSSNFLSSSDVFDIGKHFSQHFNPANRVWNRQEKDQLKKWLSQMVNKYSAKQPEPVSEEHLLPHEEILGKSLEVPPLEPVGINRGRGTRKLLDMYADSLRHVNRLLNAEFGPSGRRVPAHMAHFINRDIVRDMHSLWNDEFEQTSSHKLRAPDDMQFSFSYFYFLIHQQDVFDPEQVWDEFIDVDHSGDLDDNELRTLAVLLKGVPLPPNSTLNLKSKLLNCSSGDMITLTSFMNCSTEAKKLNVTFSSRHKNRHEDVGTDDVAFVMIGNNASLVQRALDGIREKRKKFICLNDNMNHSMDGVHDVQQALQNFFRSLFPFPSSFELPEGRRNEYDYIQDMRVAASNMKIQKTSGNNRSRDPDHVASVRGVEPKPKSKSDSVRLIRAQLDERERLKGRESSFGVEFWPLLGVLSVLIVLCILFFVLVCGKKKPATKQKKHFHSLLN